MQCRARSRSTQIRARGYRADLARWRSPRCAWRVQISGRACCDRGRLGWWAGTPGRLELLPDRVESPTASTSPLAAVVRVTSESAQSTDACARCEPRLRESVTLLFGSPGLLDALEAADPLLRLGRRCRRSRTWLGARIRARPVAAVWLYAELPEREHATACCPTALRRHSRIVDEHERRRAPSTTKRVCHTPTRLGGVS